MMAIKVIIRLEIKHDYVHFGTIADTNRLRHIMLRSIQCMQFLKWLMPLDGLETPRRLHARLAGWFILPVRHWKMNSQFIPRKHFFLGLLSLLNFKLNLFWKNFRKRVDKLKLMSYNKYVDWERNLLNNDE